MAWRDAPAIMEEAAGELETLAKKEHRPQVKTDLQVVAEELRDVAHRFEDVVKRVPAPKGGGVDEAEPDTSDQDDD